MPSSATDTGALDSAREHAGRGTRRRPPGPGWYTLVRQLKAIAREPLAALLALHRDYGDVVWLNAVLVSGCLVRHPDHVKHVLHDRHTIYDKDTFDYRMLKPLLGEGLLTADGASWLQQRRLMQPAFHHQRIAGFGALMTARTEAMLQRWEGAAADGTALDVAAQMTGLALDIVTRALFGVDLGAEAHAVGPAFTTLNRHVTAQFYSMRAMLPWLAGWEVRRARRTLDQIVYAIIARRRTQPAADGDLLSLLLAARDATTGEGMSDRQLRDEVLTLLIAGHETTANLLSWLWYLVSTRPDVERRLHGELGAVLNGRPPTVDDLPRLQYTRMVIDETLRLYPPAWITSRAPTEDDEIGGYDIPAKAFVGLSPYATHRHPDFWDNPEAFDPDRFTPAAVAARPRFAYFPFGGGPRQCIGNDFALTEAALVVATVAQRYRLAGLPGQRVVPEPLVTLRPRGGLPMTVHRLSR